MARYKLQQNTKSSELFRAFISLPVVSTIVGIGEILTASLLMFAGVLSFFTLNPLGFFQCSLLASFLYLEGTALLVPFLVPGVYLYDRFKSFVKHGNNENGEAVVERPLQ
jgi:hypothetical protein